MKLGVNCMSRQWKCLCSSSFAFWNMWLLDNHCLIEFLNLSYFSPFWMSILLNRIHLWLGFHFMNFWVSGMHPLPLNHFPPLRACCVLNVCITPFFPDAPFCLLWWRYCTLLSCMLSRPQCNLVCVIFSHECMHTGRALACGITAFQGRWVGVLVMNLMGECVYCEIFGEHASHLHPPVLQN